jgi:alpha-1,2-mannosyltransferase
MHGNPLSPRWQAFWACIGVPWLVITLVGVGVGMIPREPTDPRFHGNDLMQDWLSAKAYFASESIYASMDETMPRFMKVKNAEGPNSLHVNGHPPPAVWLLLPLGGLSFGMATTVWNTLSLAAVGLALWAIISRRGLNIDSSFIWPMVVLVFCSAPLLSQTATAQFNGVLLLLLTGAWLGQRNGASWCAGALIGVAASMKLFPLFFLFIFALQRDWKALLGGVCSFAAMVLISIAVFGTDSWRVYIQEVMPSLDGWRGAHMNSSLAGFWSHLFDPGYPSIKPIVQSQTIARIGTLICSLVVAAIAGWTAWRATTIPERDRAFGAGVVAMVLCSPTAWDHYWLMLALPLAILWFTSLAETSGYERPKSQALFAAVFWLCVVLLGVVRQKWIWELAMGDIDKLVAFPIHSLTALAYPTYCLLLLFGMLVVSRDAEADDRLER